MMTVKELSNISGVTIRTLHYYDEIDLLKPEKLTEKGYRLYGDEQIKKLYSILFFKELEFPLEKIKSILEDKSFDAKMALSEQIELLTIKRNRLDSIINLASKLESKGDMIMEFNLFDNEKAEEYKRKAKEKWGETSAYKEFEEKTRNRSSTEEKNINIEFMDIFGEFSKLKENGYSKDELFFEVEKLKKYITDNFYTCTDEILSGLGQMYGAGGEFTENIDGYAGFGTAEFTANAISDYINSKKQEENLCSKSIFFTEKSC